MASCKKVSVALCVVLAVVAAGPAARQQVSAASAHLHFYMHDLLGSSAVEVVRGPRGMFGNTVVMDDVLTEGPASTSAVVGRAQGQYIVASSQGGMDLMVAMNVVLSSGPFAGSSVTVVGRDDTGAAVRELTVVGGTGQFRMARGYVLWRTIRPDLLELDIYVNP
ncbi:dirigent protein 21-like [Oryza brachyantha]|uniref:dirigent protein 21-like n=1 Tax=Oryza brachyantha TaxID=4533 RepID=UPI001ADABD12|nr:dirigent protein 21-like [Oryza brachyantha]